MKPTQSRSASHNARQKAHSEEVKNCFDAVSHHLERPPRLVLAGPIAVAERASGVLVRSTDASYYSQGQLRMSPQASQRRPGAIYVAALPFLRRPRGAES